ncbi:hypothetical protein C2E23DRAFT_808336 [Lenzites betulinus]|nr:hypothetical protein C2E23DRAFT_808336 [Lenzites betulinus]
MCVGCSVGPARRRSRRGRTSCSLALRVSVCEKLGSLRSKVPDVRARVVFPVLPRTRPSAIAAHCTTGAASAHTDVSARQRGRRGAT